MKAAYLMTLPAAVGVSLMMFAVAGNSGLERREAAIVPQAEAGPPFMTSEMDFEDLAPITDEEGMTPVFFPMQGKIVEVNSRHMDVN